MTNIEPRSRACPYAFTPAMLLPSHFRPHRDSDAYRRFHSSSKGAGQTNKSIIQFQAIQVTRVVRSPTNASFAVKRPSPGTSSAVHRVQSVVHRNLAQLPASTMYRHYADQAISSRTHQASLVELASIDPRFIQAQSKSRMQLSIQHRQGTADNTQGLYTSSSNPVEKHQQPRSRL